MGVIKILPLLICSLYVTCNKDGGGTLAYLVDQNDLIIKPYYDIIGANDNNNNKFNYQTILDEDGDGNGDGNEESQVSFETYGGNHDNSEPPISGLDKLQLEGLLRKLNSREHEEVYLLEDKDYPKSLYEQYSGVGQLSGIAALPGGDLAIFHRADREWTGETFDNLNHVVNAKNPRELLIRNDTIMILDGENGSPIGRFGSNLFYMPHSIASDSKGNLWLSDVARHQIVRIPIGKLATNQTNDHDNNYKKGYSGKPDVVLGEEFVPGKDERHFCQPSELTLSSDDRLLFVADGYCNQRIMVFSGLSGNFLTSFGENLGMNVVHSLTLFEERNLICASDRENGRVLCFKAGLGNQLDTLGELVLDLKYPLGKVFAISAITQSHLLVSSNQYNTNRFDLAALNPFSNEIKQIWSSSDLLAPHSLATTRDGLYVYAADISKEAYKKVFRFNIIQRTT